MASRHGALPPVLSSGMRHVRKSATLSVDIDVPSTLSSHSAEHAAQPADRTDASGVPHSRIFYVDNVLSEEECHALIESTESAGYHGLDEEYPSEYRNNERVLVISEGLAQGVWERLVPILGGDDVVNLRPVGFGNEGSWYPTRLNECFRFGKYKPGCRFAPHYDGPWVPRLDESSIYTVIIYLNDSFDGGKTLFLDAETGKTIHSVTPRTGRALMFNHDSLHEGEGVTAGVKYLIRTDIMFSRLGSAFRSDAERYREKPSYWRCAYLYREADRLERENAAAYVGAYLQALDLQLSEQRSLDDTQNGMLALSHEVWVNIFGFLGCKEKVMAMEVCRRWNGILRDGSLWVPLFQEHFPERYELEQELLGRTNPAIRDWYTAYRMRFLQQRYWKRQCNPHYQCNTGIGVASVYLGRTRLFSTGKFKKRSSEGVVETDCEVNIMEPVIRKYPMYDHFRRRVGERWGLGHDTEESFLTERITYDLIQRDVQSWRVVMGSAASRRVSLLIGILVCAFGGPSEQFVKAVFDPSTYELRTHYQFLGHRLMQPSVSLCVAVREPTALVILFEENLSEETVGVKSLVSQWARHSAGKWEKKPLDAPRVHVAVVHNLKRAYSFSWDLGCSPQQEDMDELCEILRTLSISSVVAARETSWPEDDDESIEREKLADFMNNVEASVGKKFSCPPIFCTGSDIVVGATQAAELSCFDDISIRSPALPADIFHCK